MLDFDDKELFKEDLKDNKKLLKIEISKAISRQRMIVDSPEKISPISLKMMLPSDYLRVQYTCAGFFYISLVDNFFKFKDSPSNTWPYHIKNMSNEFIFDFLEYSETEKFLLFAEGYLYEIFDNIKNDIERDEKIKHVIFSFPSTRILIKVKDFEKIHKKFILFLYKLVELVHRIKANYNFHEINFDIRYPIKFMKIQNDNSIMPFQEFYFRIYGDVYSLTKLDVTLMRYILAVIRRNLTGIKKETRQKYFSKEPLYEVIEENNIILDES